LDVRGKVVLITGASRGIGRACVDSFSRRGALVSAAARSVVAIPEAFSTQCDLTSAGDRERLLQQTLERYGRIDILVNNAGQGLYGPTETADLNEAVALFQLNFFAAVAMIQLVLPTMRAQKEGHLVNVSSLAAEIALPWMTMYSASKAALSSVSSGLRRELRGTGIQVTNILPGYVSTGFQDSARGKPPEGILKFRKHAITAEQCAEAIVRGVERSARTVVTPGSGWLAMATERLLPGMIDSPLSKMNR